MPDKADQTGDLNNEPSAARSLRYRRSYRHYRNEFAGMTLEEQEEENKSIIFFIIQRIIDAAVFVDVSVVGGRRLAKRIE